MKILAKYKRNEGEARNELEIAFTWCSCKFHLFSYTCRAIFQLPHCITSILLFSALSTNCHFIDLQKESATRLLSKGIASFAFYRWSAYLSFHQGIPLKALLYVHMYVHTYIGIHKYIFYSSIDDNLMCEKLARPLPPKKWNLSQ